MQLGPSRPLTTAEKELYQQMLAIGDGGSLPDFAETEPGAWLYAIVEAWRTEAGRDGRKGHVKDEDIAEKLRVLNGEERYDRNRFQLEFGKGKIIRDYRKENGRWVDHRYQKPVNQNTATKIIELALVYWNLNSKDAIATPEGPRWSFCTSFPGLNQEVIREIAWKSGELMFVRPNIDVFCRPAVGLGPRTLLTQLGDRGYNLVIIAHDAEAVRLDDPDTQIRTFAEILNLLLCKKLGEILGTVNIWLLDHPDSWDLLNSESPFQNKLKKARRIEHLRYLLKTLLWAQDESRKSYEGMNVNPSESKGDSPVLEFPYVPLDRCFIAIFKAENELDKESGPFRTKSPEVWMNFGIPEESREYITMYAANNDNGVQSKFFIFPHEKQANVAPYIEINSTSLEQNLNKLIEYISSITSKKSNSAGYNRNEDSTKPPVGYNIITAEDFICCRETF